jgi:rhamnogalacturonan endolyase
VVIIIGVTFLFATTAGAQRYMEKLDRGVVAIHQGGGRVYVGWRMLGTDPETIAFNLYRSTGGGIPVKLNGQPITKSTNYVDNTADLSRTNSYFVRPMLNGQEQAASESAEVWSQNYLSISLRTPEGYRPNDASVGDLDGDGRYDIVLHQTGRRADNARAGSTDEPILEAYKTDGTLLWRINLGKNIREGAHYTQFMVYDLDSDGKAEVACKTANGTIDGVGNVIGDANADWVNGDGKILDGPEFFTIFDGQSGAALATTDYIPPRGDVGGWGGIGGNGGNDRTGNRVDRFLACVAYLDGVRPSVVMCRGYYGRSVLAAWDFRDGQLTSRWVFDSGSSYRPYSDASPYSGQGNHNLSVADVDDDGKDEIVYGSMCVDDDGTGLYSTGLRHGDAMHLSDIDPDRPGLEVWGIHENEYNPDDGYGAALFSAGTGEVYWGKGPGVDVGRGLAMDIDPRHRGYECWARGGPTFANVLFNCKGQVIANTKPGSTNFGIWWDGDLLRENLDRNRISKWDWTNNSDNTILTAVNCSSNNGSKATPVLSADIFGDWREEVIWRTTDNRQLRIYTTTIPTEHRFYTLMHDPQYRLSIAWQNVAYNQPPHVGFSLGVGMQKPPRPAIRTPAISRSDD